jgi:hypothetical protein
MIRRRPHALPDCSTREVRGIPPKRIVSSFGGLAVKRKRVYDLREVLDSSLRSLAKHQ